LLANSVPIRNDHHLSAEYDEYKCIHELLKSTLKFVKEYFLSEFLIRYGLRVLPKYLSERHNDETSNKTKDGSKEEDASQDANPGPRLRNQAEKNKDTKGEETAKKKPMISMDLKFKPASSSFKVYATLGNLKEFEKRERFYQQNLVKIEVRPIIISLSFQTIKCLKNFSDTVSKKNSECITVQSMTKEYNSDILVKLERNLTNKPLSRLKCNIENIIDNAKHIQMNVKKIKLILFNNDSVLTTSHTQLLNQSKLAPESLLKIQYKKHCSYMVLKCRRIHLEICPASREQHGEEF
jgi:hypothetical protein